MLTFTGSLEGSDGTVVLLHAFPLSGSMWEPQIRFLTEQGYKVVAPHVYGFEATPSRPGWSMEDFAVDLAELLDTVGAQHATIVGLSMGGYLALSFYRIFPDWVAYLVLCDTRAGSDSPAVLEQRKAFREAVMESGATEAAARMVPNFFARPAAEGVDSALEQLAREMITRQTAFDISEAMRAIAERRDSTEVLVEMRCPLLIVNGSEDRVTPAENARSMHALAPSSKLEIIPEAGHISNLEQPALFNELLLNHLEERAWT